MPNITGDPNAPLNLALVGLETSDYALPPLWDSRYQQLLNNDAILNKALTRLLSGESAARRLNGVSGTTALKAMTGLTDGETTYVQGRGVYRYYQTATDPASDPFVIVPDQGGGRWKLEMVPASLLGANGGVATLDAQGFLKQAPKGKSITSEALADEAVTASKLAVMEPNDQAEPNAASARLGTIVSWLSFMIRSITGGTTWRAAPPVSLATLNEKAARTDKEQTFSQKQTFSAGISVGLDGLAFPPDAFGGIGDRARIFVTRNVTDAGAVANTEATAMVIEVSNDDPYDIVIVQAPILKASGQIWAVGGFTQASSGALKTNIHAYAGDALDVLSQVHVVSFTYRDDAARTPHIGFIAEDTPKDLSGEAQNSMQVGSTIGVLIRAVQQLTRRVEDLERR